MLASLLSLSAMQLAAVFVAVVVSISVEVWLVVEAIRSRARADGLEPPLVEVAWTLLPGILLGLLFLYSAGHTVSQ